MAIQHEVYRASGPYEDNFNGITRKFLDRFLANPDWQAGELYDMLEGYTFPPILQARIDEDPIFVWVLRNLPNGEQRDLGRFIFAQRLATIIDNQPDQNVPTHDPDTFFANLFHIAAGLKQPLVLAEPLHRMYRREPFPKVQGSMWHARRGAFTSAVAANQVDDRYHNVWIAMIRDGLKADITLLGTESDGFIALASMPTSPDTVGNANENALIEALNEIEPYARAHDESAFLFGVQMTAVLPGYNLKDFLQEPRDNLKESARQIALARLTSWQQRFPEN